MAATKVDRSESLMGIAELAQRAGVTPRTIRYYVAEGLLPAPGGRGQHRAYRQEHLDRLEAIRALKAAYLPLHEIRRRLDGSAGQAAPAPTTPVVAVGSAMASHTIVSSAAPGPVTATLSAPRPSAAVSPDSRLPFGFGGSPPVGRIEIYEPAETTWKRHVLAPDIELHVRSSSDPRLAELVERLLKEAAAILDARPRATPGA